MSSAGTNAGAGAPDEVGNQQQSEQEQEGPPQLPYGQHEQQQTPETHASQGQAEVDHPNGVSLLPSIPPSPLTPARPIPHPWANTPPATPATPLPVPGTTNDLEDAPGPDSPLSPPSPAGSLSWLVDPFGPSTPLALHYGEHWVSLCHIVESGTGSGRKIIAGGYLHGWKDGQE